jgi:transketolase
MRNTWLKTLYKISHKNSKTVFIGSDLGANVMNDFKKSFPNRFFMEGISEQHIIGLAAGLSMNGFLPYVNTIATFLTRRCFEQNMIDLCLHNLPVKLIGNGGGLVYGPLGPTHQAIEDFAIMNTMPNMTIVAVCDAHEMKNLIEQSVKMKGPLYVRLSRGDEKIISKKKKFKLGKLVVYKKPEKITLLSTGTMAQECLKASDILKKQNINCGVIHFHTIKPLDISGLSKQIKNVKNIITVEEHISTGGFGSIVLENLNNLKKLNKIKVDKICLPNTFNKFYGTHDELKEHYNLNYKQIIKKIKEIKKSEKK